MKFEMHTYWKHENCRDSFISVSTVVADSGLNAILHVTWCTQAVKCWFFSPAQGRIKVNKENYGKWKPYTPQGKIYL